MTPCRCRGAAKVLRYPYVVDLFNSAKTPAKYPLDLQGKRSGTRSWAGVSRNGSANMIMPAAHGIMQH
jgi:hypothetical protein